MFHSTLEKSQPMKKTILAATSLLLLPLAVAVMLLPVHTAWAKDKHAAGMEAMQPIEVKVDNFTFNPAAINIPVNSTVNWVNEDDIPHVIAGNDGSFKSKALDTDQEYSHTFTKAGTYPYYCPIHPKMVGKIIVH
jgi:plastocyanin